MSGPTLEFPSTVLLLSSWLSWSACGAWLSCISGWVWKALNSPGDATNWIQLKVVLSNRLAMEWISLSQFVTCTDFNYSNENLNDLTRLNFAGGRGRAMWADCKL